MSAPRLDPAAVLAHRDYVERLARKLVFDRSLADDVAQDVWAIALERPPKDRGTLKRWLAAVVRNAARLERRSKSRRETREHEVARDERISAADELVEREALRKSVVEAVLALDEPYRETVILRFFDELPPRAIAARTGVPVDTVKTRLKRGLETLRARLDRRFGSRASWCLALVERLELAPTAHAALALGIKSLLGGVAAMTTAQKLGIAAVVVLVAVSFVRWPLEVAQVSSSGPEGRTNAPELVTHDADANARAALSAARASPPTKAIAATSEAKTVGVLEVLAQWRDDGQPIPGVWVTLSSLDDAPTPLEPRSLRTNAKGLVRFEDVPPGDVALECDRGVQDYGLVQAGKTRRKSLRLDRGVTVAGHVFDLAGAPVANAEIWLTRDSDFIDGFPVAQSGADGAYSIAGVHSGERYVGAREPHHAPSGSHHVYANSGSTLTLDLVLGGPSGSVSGRVLDARGNPIEGAQVVVGPKDAPEIIRSDGVAFLTPDGCATKSDERGAFEIRGLLAGESWIEARARGYLVGTARIEIPDGGWVSSDVVLERGVTLTGVVLASNGGPARFAAVDARSNADHETHSARTELDGTFRLEGLRPGATVLHAEWGDQEWSDATRELGPGDAVWNPTLERGRDLFGRVLGADGEPVRGLSVVVERRVRDDEPFLRAATTDADGRFRVRGCADREHALRVFPRDSQLFPWLELERVRPSDDELVLRLDDALLPSVRIVGRVVTQSGAAPGNTTIMPFDRAIDYEVHELVEPDGTFSIGPLPVGEWGVVIESDGYASIGEPARPLIRDQVWDLGKVVLLPGDAVTVEFELPKGVTRDPLLVVEGLDSPVYDWLAVEGHVARSRPLAGGRYRVSVEGGGGVAAELHEVEIIPGRGAKLVLALRAGVELTLRTSEAPNDSPAKSGAFRVFDAGGALVAERSLAPRGEFAFECPLCLAPGSYRYTAEYDDGRRAAAAFEVVAGATNATLDVTLE
ncbi:MAG: sigma-70 family RNA polymerase sigma factor [Planctomycetes bacterium]|nr:sigma-70 family RNA polymerase sigma factor [Planctomycetota bacterium]